MENYICSVCHDAVDENSANTCIGCGQKICSDDYNRDTGYCKNCSDNFVYSGC